MLKKLERRWSILKIVLWEIYFKKNLLEIKTIIFEMKNTLGRINGRLDNAEEKDIEHET